MSSRSELNSAAHSVLCGPPRRLETVDAIVFYRYIYERMLLIVILTGSNLDGTKIIGRRFELPEAPDVAVHQHQRTQVDDVYEFPAGRVPRDRYTIVYLYFSILHYST